MKLWNKVKKKISLFCVNKIFAGTRPQFWEIKRNLLNASGYTIGKGTRIVGPLECYAELEIGENCWIGKNLKINGNGQVKIEDNCDIGPEVTFQTGGHEIGSSERRAGNGMNYSQKVEKGVWIGGRVTIIGNTDIHKGSVIAGGACVVKDVPENVLSGGVPAKVIRRLDE